MGTAEALNEAQNWLATETMAKVHGRLEEWKLEAKPGTSGSSAEQSPSRNICLVTSPLQHTGQGSFATAYYWAAFQASGAVF